MSFSFCRYPRHDFGQSYAVYSEYFRSLERTRYVSHTYTFVQGSSMGVLLFRVGKSWRAAFNGGYYIQSIGVITLKLVNQEELRSIKFSYFIVSHLDLTYLHLMVDCKWDILLEEVRTRCKTLLEPILNHFKSYNIVT